MMGVGVTELAIGLMFLAGFGLPLGVPPAPENPAMQYVAPEKCVLYATWSSMNTADPNSTNHTEQMLAEPEVQAFARSIEKTIGDMVAKVSAQTDDPKVQQLAKFAPQWAKTVATRSCAAFVTRVELVENKLSFDAGFVVDAGDKAASLAEQLTKLFATPEHPGETVTLGKLTFQRFAPQPGGLIEGEVTIGAAGNYVIVGVGKDAVEGMVQRIREKKIPAWLTALQERLPVERRASMSYINVKLLTDTFLPLAGPDGERIVDALGLKQITVLESVTGLDKEGMISRGFMQIDGAPRGLLTVFDGQSITPEKIGFIPKDATIASAWSFNTLRVYTAVTKLIADNVPQGGAQIQQFEEQFAEQFGAQLAGDVLAALGDTWTIWMSPADGWLGATATIEVRDRAKLQAFFDRITAMLGDADNISRRPRIETSLFGEHKIYMFAAPEVPLRPAWALTEDKLILSLAPQSIKATLSAKPEEVGLFSAAQYASAFQGEGQVIAVQYQDSAKFFEAMYSYGLLIVPMMIDEINKQNFRSGQPAVDLPIDFAAIPSARSIHRHLKPGVFVTRRTKEGIESQSRQTFPTPSIGTSAPIAVALLLPAVQAFREAAQRMQSSNNLKQIALAMHNHHDTYRSLPPAYSQSKEGKPLLSWRVHILPFIEEQQLYSEFHLDEPWDSEHNKKLIARMPKIYQSPGGNAQPGRTQYLAIGGEKGIFPKPSAATEGHTGGVRFAEVTDGLSNTIMAIEAGPDSAEIWTKPEEFVPNEKEPLQGVTGARNGGFMAALGDGSVRFISNSIDPEVLLLLFKRNDGQAIPELP